ncbi:HalOD1 output domain-containing protein [Saliphagus sp. GCM10025334]
MSSDHSPDDRIGYDPETDTYTVSYDWASDELPSEAVVEAVAAATGSTSESIPPLYEVVDPEALDQLFVPTSQGTSLRTGVVEFQFHGCDVTISTCGRTTVTVSECD